MYPDFGLRYIDQDRDEMKLKRWWKQDGLALPRSFEFLLSDLISAGTQIQATTATASLNSICSCDALGLEFV